MSVIDMSVIDMSVIDMSVIDMSVIDMSVIDMSVIDMSVHSCFTYYFCNSDALCILSSSFYSSFTTSCLMPEIVIQSKGQEECPIEEVINFNIS